MAIVIAATTVILTVDRIAESAPFRHVWAWVKRSPVPHATPDKFAILVAQLDGDDGSVADLIVSSLADLKGVEILRLQRTIPLRGDRPQREQDLGRAKAIEYLAESGARVLIWGQGFPKVQRAKLYWTLGDGRRQPVVNPRRYDIGEDLELPELFWADLVNVLRLVSASAVFNVLEAEAVYVADKLEKPAEHVRELLQEAGREPSARGWNQSSLADVRAILAVALTVLGDQSGSDAQLTEAISLYESVIATRQRGTRTWACTSHNLGLALSRRGDMEEHSASLVRAVAALNDSLQVYTRAEDPWAWANAQNHLGVALARLGEREASFERLEQAIKAFSQAEELFERTKKPLDWAMVVANRASAMVEMDDLRPNGPWAKQAVALFKEALPEARRDTVPLQWGATQHSLGCALLGVAEGDQGTANDARDAVTAFEEASKEFTRDRLPHRWIVVQVQLLRAKVRLGELTPDVSLIRGAVAEYPAVIEFCEKKGNQLLLGFARHTFGSTLLALYKSEPKAAHLDSAAKAFRGAILARPRELTPINWAESQGSLGLVVALQAADTQGTERLKESEALLRGALAVQDTRVPSGLWARSKKTLASVLGERGWRERNVNPLLESLQHYRDVLETLKKERRTTSWATARSGEGVSLGLLGLVRHTPRDLADALVCHLDAWEVLVPLDEAEALQETKKVDVDRATLRRMVSAREYEELIDPSRPRLTSLEEWLDSRRNVTRRRTASYHGIG